MASQDVLNTHCKGFFLFFVENTGQMCASVPGEGEETANDANFASFTGTDGNDNGIITTVLRRLQPSCREIVYE